MSKILIKNGRIWDGEKFFNSDILTENAIISKIAPNINEAADFEYDAQGKIVSPGLIDAHVHLRGLNDSLGTHAELGCIPFGVTAAANAGGICGGKELIDTFLLKCLAFVSVKFSENKAYFDNTEKLLEKFGDKTVGIKVLFDTQVREVEDITPLCQVAKYAEQKGLPIMVHSSNSPVSMAELLGALRKGDILTHAYHGGINNASEDNFECIKEAKKRGIFIDAGLAGCVHVDFKILKDAILKGAIPDIISTDLTKLSAYKRGGRYGMTMCMSIVKSLGMKEDDIFRAVTSTPAKALGMDKDWGYLIPGRCADIAVFDYSDKGFDLTDKAGNHIFQEGGYKCLLTVLDGEIVYTE